MTGWCNDVDGTEIGTNGGRWRLRLLDHFQLADADGDVGLTSRKAIAIVAYLALQRDRLARRDAVANLLWESVDTVQARVNLRQAITTLRKIGTPEHPLIVADTDMLRLSPAIDIDTSAFDRLADGDATDRLAAADIYKADLLAGFTLRDAPAFNEWLAVAQAHLRQRMIGVLLASMDDAIEDTGALNAAATAGLRLLSIDPYNEAGHRALMRTYARQGRTPLAIAQYRSLSDLLRRELVVAPEAETQNLYRDLQNGRRERSVARPTADVPALPAGDHTSAESGPARIAVVDDEPALREAVASYLRMNGFEAVECSGGPALDAAFAAGDIDLVLLDVTMPDEDGFAIARRLGPDVPKIMLTAKADLIDRVVGLELGADDYVVKPFQLRELLARVRTVLRRTRA